MFAWITAAHAEEPPDASPIDVPTAEVDVRRRVMPEYPKDAANGGFEADCRMRVFIGADGLPYDTKPEDCPLVFQDSARDALMQWEWYPARYQDQPVRAQFVLAIRYRMDDLGGWKHAWNGARCEVGLRVGADGEITNPDPSWPRRCEIRDLRGAPPPEGSLGSCRVVVTVGEGPPDVRIATCPEPLHDHARALVAAWAYTNLGDETTTYEILLDY